MTKRREFIQKGFLGIGGLALSGVDFMAPPDVPFNKGINQLRLELRYIDTTRVGWAIPDSSAAVDIDGDGEVEIITSMQDADGHPEILLYKRNKEGGWDSHTIGVVHLHKGETEYVAVGRPFPGDSRICVAASVQHKEEGLVVFRLREPGLSPFKQENWEGGVAKGYAGQGLAFQDLDGDGIDELIYCTQVEMNLEC